MGAAISVYWSITCTSWIWIGTNFFWMYLYLHVKKYILKGIKSQTDSNELNEIGKCWCASTRQTIFQITSWKSCRAIFENSPAICFCHVKNWTNLNNSILWLEGVIERALGDYPEQQRLLKLCEKFRSAPQVSIAEPELHFCGGENALSISVSCCSL